MNDPKLERCKQVIKQYEENQKKQKIELSKKPKIRPPKISIPKKTTQKDIVKDIKKMNYTGVQDIKDKVAKEIEFSKKPKKQTSTREEKPKPMRSSISENIKKKINQETPKKDKYLEAIDKDTSLTNFLDKLRDMEDEESEEEVSLFSDKQKKEANKRIDEQNKRGLTLAQKKAEREKETKEREDRQWKEMVQRREERRKKSGFYKPVRYLDDDDEDY